MIIAIMSRSERSPGVFVESIPPWRRLWVCSTRMRRSHEQSVWVRGGVLHRRLRHRLSTAWLRLCLFCVSRMSSRLSSVQIDAYLERIGLQPAEVRASPIDKHLLARIHLAHLTTVPFENAFTHLASVSLDAPDVPVVWRYVATARVRADTRSGGPGASADLQSSYDAIVVQRRGGNCFAINGAFAALLQGLGFVAAMVRASACTR